MLVMNLIIVDVAGTDGVAVYSTGWRVSTIAILPLLGIATAVVPISGAAFGARAFDKLTGTFHYAIRIGLVMEIIIGAATFILAPQIAGLFTQAEGAVRIADDLIIFMRIACLFYPGAAFGIMSSSLFQGTGKGVNALIATLLRTVVFTPPLSYLFAVNMGIGLPGVWWGLVMANVAGAVISFSWVKVFIRGLVASGDSQPGPTLY